MKKAVLAIGAVVVLLSSLSFGQQAAAEREKDHEALRGLMTKVTQALNEQDMDALASCFTPQFSLVAVDQTLITNKESLVAYYDTMFRSEKSPLKSMVAAPKADAPTRFVDGNTGICHGTSKDAYVFKNGRTVVMESKWTAVLVKEGETWKIASAHTGVNFLDNPLRPRGFWKKFALLFH